LVVMVLAASCAGLTNSIREQNCDEDHGFETGMNDAREGKPMNSGFAQICDERDAERVRRGYRAGFEAGLASQKPQYFAYTCTYDSLTFHYRENGDSADHARSRVLDRCRAENQAPFCDANLIQCLRNP
jgi:hypothetical protein